MIRSLSTNNRAQSFLVGAAVLALSFWFGSRASQLAGPEGLNFSAMPIRLLAGLGMIGLLAFATQNLGRVLTLLVIAAGTINVRIETGTASMINVAIALTALVTAAWLLRLLVQRDVPGLVACNINRPLFLFVAVLFVSWLVGSVLWDVRVMPPSNALMVQAAQVAIFILSGAALLLGANVPLRERTLRLWTITAIVIAVWGQANQILNLPNLPMIDISQPPLAMGFVLLFSQLILNTDLRSSLRFIGWAVVLVWAVTTFGTNRSQFVGGWLPIAIGGIIILWFRSRKLVYCALALGLLIFFIRPAPFMREFGAESGSSTFFRPYIWWDVIRMTFGSPISILFGLGPVNYKWNWLNPDFVSQSQPLTGTMYISYNTGVFYAPPSHNMFVDIYAQTGLIGFLLFAWILVTIIKDGYHFVNQVQPGYMRAYAIGVLAGFASLAIASGITADWLIPFVYNITVSGFRASVYAWLLVGTVIGLYARQRNPEQRVLVND